jgi:hypothetical protein
VDGRQAVSTGVALEDLAALMLRLGCVEAINLDGGGSTTFNIGGLTVNRPSEGSERPVANALLVFSTSYVPAPVPVGEPLPVIAGPATIKVGQVADYRLVGVDGEDVPPSEVVWGAQGAAWVDQAGFLRGWEEGECRLTALARGQSVTLRVTVAKG